MLQCSVVSNITMKGRLKRCRNCRSAFVNIKDFFKAKSSLDASAGRDDSLSRIAEKQGLCRHQLVRCASANFSLIRPGNQPAKLFAKKCGCLCEAFCFDCGFLCASFQSGPLKLDSQTCRHAVESLAIDAENLSGS